MEIVNMEEEVNEVLENSIDQKGAEEENLEEEEISSLLDRGWLNKQFITFNNIIYNKQFTCDNPMIVGWLIHTKEWEGV